MDFTSLQLAAVVLDVPHILMTAEHYRGHFLAEEWPPPCSTQLKMWNKEQQAAVLTEGGMMLAELHNSLYPVQTFCFNKGPRC